MSDGDDDLQPTTDHTARNVLVGLALLGLAGGAAWYANDRNDTERRARELARASAAWADLARCLAGERWRVGEVAVVSRHRELSIPRTVRDLPEADRLRVWPWRCAAPAQALTHALFESRSEAPAHRLLNQFASVAATELARGALRTGSTDPRHYLDELFAAAERAELPAAPPSTVALPPEPVRYLDARRVRPLYRSAGGSVVAAEQPLDDGALRVLLGRGELRVCDFDRALDAPDCARVPALDRARRPALTSSLYPRMPGYLTRTDDEPLSVGSLLHPGHLDAPLATTASSALRVGLDAWIIAARAPDGRYALGPGVTFPGAVTPPRLHGAIALSFADVPAPAPTTPDGGVGDVPDAHDVTDAATSPERWLLAGVVAETLPARWVAPPSVRGTLRSDAREALVRACRMGESTVAVAHGDDGHALVLWWNGSALTVRTVDARAGTAACHDGRLRLAWYTNVPRPVVHVTTCAATGACTTAEGAIPFTETSPRVATVGEQVLAVYGQDDQQGLRYRFAALDALATAPEVVVFDDGAHDGVAMEAAPTLLVRGDAAVVLATRRDGLRETWALRIDARGYRALRPRE
jgi:hypothetical protein